MPSLTFLVPGKLETLTGGYAYDRRIVAGLRDRGWSVAVRELDSSFPFPTPAAREDAARALADIPADSTVLVDGLALGAMPDEAEREAGRLRLVALVHHPLAEETGIDRRRADALEASERRALAVVRRMIVTSRATASTLARYGVDEDWVTVVEPGTDPAPLARGSQGPLVQLLCVATVIPRKGHEILLRALAMIPESDWRLTCAGSLRRDPVTADRVRAEVRAQGWNDRVLLAGEVDAVTLDGYYDSADLFALPAIYEGYGMAVAEAIARGLPVIGTDTGAVAELLRPDKDRGGWPEPDLAAGILIPPGDVHALATALSRAIGSASVRAALAQGARRARERLPTWEDAARRLADALERADR